MARGSCDACGDIEELTTCDMCNATICTDHKKRVGCAVCGGETAV